jgi:hypothetical protein
LKQFDDLAPETSILDLGQEKEMDQLAETHLLMCGETRLLEKSFQGDGSFSLNLLSIPSPSQLHSEWRFQWG